MKTKKVGVLRVLALHEQLGGRSLFSAGELTDEDAVSLMYAYTCLSAGIHSRGVFNDTMKTAKFQNMISDGVGEIIKELTLWGEVMDKGGAGRKRSDGEDEDPPTVSDVVGILVSECGLSPEYVMDEMALWEIPIYLNGLFHKTRSRMEEQRLFAFIGLTPWLDKSGRVSKPSDLLTFPWEKDAGSSKSFVEEHYKSLHKLLDGKEYE